MTNKHNIVYWTSQPDGGWQIALLILQNVEEFNSAIHVVSYTLTNRPDCLLQSAENGFYCAEKDDYQG